MKPVHFLIFPFLILLALIYVGCSKSSTSKHPKITLVSIDKLVPLNGSFTALFNFDNSGGTLSNGLFVAKINRINQVPPANTIADSIGEVIPDFNGASKGQFQFQLPYTPGLSTGSNQPDTFVFTFYALTPDTLSSDTITSPQIIVLNQ